jgi:hypothetical protein
MPGVDPIKPNTIDFLGEKPRRRPDGSCYACYRLRRHFGDRSETDSEVSKVVATEAEALEWLNNEATRFGFAA